MSVASLCQAKSIAAGGHGLQHKKLIDNVQVAPENADGTTVMCLIYTIAKNHAGGPSEARDTWGSKCDGFMVMSSMEDPSLPSAQVTHEGPEEYNNIWQKVRSIWKYVEAAGYSREFDWFFIGGDDLFVIPSNLRAYLKALPTDKPIFLGRRFQIPNGQFFNSGGAGIYRSLFCFCKGRTLLGLLPFLLSTCPSLLAVSGYGLNRAALKILVDNLDNIKVGWENDIIALNRCIKQLLYACFVAFSAYLIKKFSPKMSTLLGASVFTASSHTTRATTTTPHQRLGLH